MNKDFTLDQRLQDDCIRLAGWQCSEVLLMNNRNFPWFILVPRVNVYELCDMTDSEQQMLMREINRLSRFVRAQFPVEKLNVATISNIVRQMHVHVIGRRTDDACWPGVVWGSAAGEHYGEAEIAAVRDALLRSD